MENQAATATNEVKTKFCKHCGAKIPEDAVICTACGRQVEEMNKGAAQPSIVINNANTNTNTNTGASTPATPAPEKSPETGDSIALYIVMMAISAAAMVLVAKKRFA